MLAKFTALLLTLCSIGLFAQGCGDTTKSEFEGNRSVIFHEDGSIEYLQAAKGEVFQQWPKGAKDPGGADIDYNGVGTRQPGLFDSTLADAAAKTALPYHAAAIALLLGAVYVGGFMHRYKTAAIMVAGALLIASFPIITGKVGAWLGIMFIVAITGAAVFAIYMVWKRRKDANKVADKLEAKGDLRASVAIKRFADPTYNESREWEGTLPPASGTSSVETESVQTVKTRKSAKNK
jgi:hypothetical protein